MQFHISTSLTLRANNRVKPIELLGNSVVNNFSYNFITMEMGQILLPSWSLYLPLEKVEQRGVVVMYPNCTS